MLKWAVPNQRRESIHSDNLDTISNHSGGSDSSSHITDLTIPIRYHDRACRPKSLALSPSFSLDLNGLSRESSIRSRRSNSPPESRRVSKTISSPITSGHASCSKATLSSKRHSMHVGNTSMQLTEHKPSEPLRISTSFSVRRRNNSLNDNKTENPANTSDDGILKISTGTKDKSRNNFWRNLRAKAQGRKNSTKTKLSKAHSMSNLPVNEQSQQKSEEHTSPPNDEHSGKHPTGKASGINRRRSFKLLKKQNEGKKPKAFTKQLSISTDCDSVDGENNISPDSGISGLRLNSDSLDSSDEGASPCSPVTPIEVGKPNNLTHLRQQFTDAVLQYLNERLEQKGMEKNNSISSSIRSTSSHDTSASEDGSADIFCYDTDTVLRRPTQSRIAAS